MAFSPAPAVSRTSTAELILYACPHGELAGQIQHYFKRAKKLYNWNPAHDFMPHCSLTGFFHDTTAVIPEYAAAIQMTLAEKQPLICDQVIQVHELLLCPDFHGLILSSDWLLRFVSAFAVKAPTASRTDRLRLKHWLHLSLAYRFAEAEHEPLAALARRIVAFDAPASWSLDLYQRHADKTWTCHGRWPLEKT